MIAQDTPQQALHRDATLQDRPSFQRIVAVVVTTFASGFAIFAGVAYGLTLIPSRVPMIAFAVTLLASLMLALLFALLGGVELASGSRHTSPWTRRDHVLGSLPYLVLLPGIIASLANRHNQLASHGLFHLALVEQILNGFIPPESSVLAGYPATIYWLYHLLIATLVKATAITPPLMAAIINAVALLGSLYVAKQIVGRITTQAWHPAIVASLTIFIVLGMNVLGSVFAAGSLLGEPPPSILYRMSPFGMTPRLSNLSHKFFDFTPVSLGVLYFELMLLIGIRSLQDGVRMVDLAVAGLALAGAAAYHTQTALAMSVSFPAALGLLAIIAIIARQVKAGWWRIKGWRDNSAARNVFSVVLCGISAGVVLAMGHYVWRTSTSGPSMVRLFVPAYYRANMRNLIFPLLPLALFAILGLGHALKHWRPGVVWAGLVGLTNYGLIFVFHVELYNEYKFVYLGTLAFLIPAAVGIERLLAREETAASDRVLRAVGSGALGLVLLNVFVVGFSDRYIFYQEYAEPIIYNGRYVEMPNEQNADTYRWIRENTDVATVVIVPLDHRDMSLVPGLAARRVSVLIDPQFGGRVNSYRRRHDATEILFSANATEQNQQEALSILMRDFPQTPLVAIAPHDLPTGDTLREMGFDEVFDGMNASVFALQD